jgi:nitroreductase
LSTIIDAAVTAPDHGQLRPWHFLVVAGDRRGDLGQVFAQAHRAREPQADPGVIEKTASKPLRAPMIVAVICRPVSAEQAWNAKFIPEWEQTAAVAAATQNLCLAAHALGFGSMWRTGWYGDAPEVREALGLAQEDQLVGWVYLGTIPQSSTPAPRRPTDLDQRVVLW